MDKYVCGQQNQVNSQIAELFNATFQGYLHFVNFKVIPDYIELDIFFVSHLLFKLKYIELNILILIFALMGVANFNFCLVPSFQVAIKLTIQYKNVFYLPKCHLTNISRVLMR